MKAMIFAAGLGTRLKPLTDTMPKALVPIAGKSLLQHNLEKLASQGFDEIVINIHHFSDQIRDFLNQHNNFGLNIYLSDESEELLDTGGGIKKAEEWLNDEPFLVHNVDILSNADLKGLYEQHCLNDALATLLVSNRKTARYLLFDQNKVLKGWINKSNGETKSPYPNFEADEYSPYAFSGIHVLSPSIFTAMKEYPLRFPIMDFYLKEAVKYTIKGSIADNLKMVDVGKFDSLNDAEYFFNKEINSNHY